MECEPNEAKVIANGTLNFQPWTEWRILKCAGEKPSLWVFGPSESSAVYGASKGKLGVLGFLDGNRAARKLEDIGVTWRISQGTHGYKAPVWLLREGKNTLVFVDATQQSLRVLGKADADCGQQVDIDPGETGIVVTIRKPKTGDVVEQLSWPLTKMP